MSPTTGPNDILRDDNYFFWEFNTRMTLARKDLLHHVTLKLDEDISGVDRSSHAWRVADMKAFAIVSRLLSPQFQSMVRETSSAREAWEVLEAFFVRRNLHNRIQLRRQLHEFKMPNGASILDHLMQFDNLCLGMAAVGDALQDDEKLVILLGSLSSDYSAMIKIIENTKDVALIEAKEMLRREFEVLQNQDHSEIALNAHRPIQRRKFQRGGENKQQTKRFAGRCFKCDRVGHKQSECRSGGNKRGDRGGKNNSEFVFAASRYSSDSWILDSGASSHMSHERRDFVKYQPLKSTIGICVADGTMVKAVGVGSVEIALLHGPKITITEVLYVPELDRRLLSVPSLTAKGVEVCFERGVCTLKLNGQHILRIPQSGKLYELEASPVANDRQDAQHAHAADVDVRVSASEAKKEIDNGDHAAEIWHARLGHIPTLRMQSVVQVVDGLPSLLSCALGQEGALCDGCVMGKMSSARYNKKPSMVKTTKPLEIVHSDLMGPMDTKTPSGARYALTLIDDFSRLTSIYFLRNKSEVYDHVIEYKVMMEKQLELKLKCIRTDNGGEFVNKKFAAYCRKQGIVHQKTTPYNPQQNGIAERMNRTITEMSRAMLYYKHVEKRWWAEAMNTAVYIINRIPNSARPSSTPHEVCFGVRPSLKNLHVFGSNGYAFVDSSKRSKLDSKAVPCMLLGYSTTTKGYRVWNKQSRKVMISRTIALDERVFPGYQTVNLPDAEVTWNSSTFDDDDVIARSLLNPTPASPMDVDEVGGQSSALDLWICPSLWKWIRLTHPWSCFQVVDPSIWRIDRPSTWSSPRRGYQITHPALYQDGAGIV